MPTVLRPEECKLTEPQPKNNQILKKVFQTGIEQRNLGKRMKNKICKICQIEDCGEVVYAISYCRSHYIRFKRGRMQADGSPTIKNKSVCAIDGCNCRPTATGLCAVHSYRKNTGRMNPDGTLIPAERGRPICRIEGCNNEINAQGLCHTHYNRFKTGRLNPDGTLNKIPKSVCSMEGCNNVVQTSGLCQKHHSHSYYMKTRTSTRLSN